MKPPPYVVVGGWAAGLTVLALMLFFFTPNPIVAVMYLFFTGIVAAFGLAVLLAARRGREHEVQRRQPRRATAAAFAAIAAGVAATGLAYGWLMPLLAIYPLGVALWMLRGERLPAGARPWPVAAGDAAPAGPARIFYHGEAVGEAVPVPEAHPAHAAPAQPAEPARVPTAAKAGWVVYGARALGRLIRGRL